MEMTKNTLLNMSFVILILTIAFNHTVAVIAHIAEELDNRETRRLGVYTANAHLFIWWSIEGLVMMNIMMSAMSSKAIFLPGCNESHSKPTPSSHNADDRGKASHTWHTQNAVNKNKCCWGTGEKTPNKGMWNWLEAQLPTHGEGF